MARDSAMAIAPEELLQAYRLGYFPMARARDDAEVVWVLPDERGVIPVQGIRITRSLKKFVKSHPFDVRVNTDFVGVMAGCAEATDGRPETWINDFIIEAYTDLHHNGRAHSVECWRDDELVGGLYGVSLGAAFCGESMFSRETNASKVAMAYLMALAKAGGFDFIDAQFFNDHLVQFGLIGIENGKYQDMLAHAINQRADILSAKDQLSVDFVLQSITQTS